MSQNQIFLSSIFISSDVILFFVLTSWKPKGHKLSVYLVKTDIPYLCSTLKYEWKRDDQKPKRKDN